MKQENNRIIAEEGKVLKRIQDGFVFGKEISLGYMYYINDELVDPPILATAEMFEEIDDPNIEGVDK